MSVPIAQRKINFKRMEEAPQMDVLFPTFKEITMLAMSPVKRNYKKMDGRLRILKHV